MHIARKFAATATELYHAFVDADRLHQWFQPAPGLVAIAGHRGEHRSSTELMFVTPFGELKLQFIFGERVPGQMLAFDLVRHDPRGTSTSSVKVSFAEQHGETTLSLQHDGLAAEQIPESEAAWRHSLGRLIGACPVALDRYSARLQGADGYQSAFGGFWPDLIDAEAQLENKRAEGELDAEEAQQFAHWLEKGYVVLKNAVPEATVDAFREQIANDWRHGNANVTIELCDGEGGYHAMHPSLHDRPHKVLDYHGVSKNARDIQFAPAIKRFLTQLFERPPMACQSLLFRYGTEQAMHQDSAYVVMRSPMQFVGCWVALEDVVEGSGELQYYEGSHRIPEYLWFDRARARPPGYEDDAEFLAWVSEKSEQAECERVRFLPKKGDALIWHADLVHGGSPRVNRELTRLSLVSHYCPSDIDPAWFDANKHDRHEHEPGANYCHLSI